MAIRHILSQAIVCAAALVWTTSWAQAQDRRGGGHHGGHGHHGHHDHDSSHFFGISPGGLSYGFQNDNFGMLIGPFGGGGYGDNYHNHGYPAYEPAVVSYPGYSYPAPAVDYGNYAPVTNSPATSSAVSGIDAPLPQAANLNSGAATFYRESVDAFRSGDYAAATKAADHAIVEDPESGMLRTYASQCLLANGEYEASAAALADGLSRLPTDQWGTEIRNFRNLYRKNDYVTHMKQLEKFAKENPGIPAGNALCAYHFYYLGHESVAQRHLEAARNADPNDLLISALGQVIPSSSHEELPSPRSSKSKAEPTSILVGPR